MNKRSIYDIIKTETRFGHSKQKVISSYPGYTIGDIMRYLAHYNIETTGEQSILEHLQGTAAFAEDFGNSFGAEVEAYRCAILHDIGKYSDAFQRRIRGASEKPDHSTAGAIESYKQRDIPASFCIAGHHGGLPDLGSRLDSAESATLFGRLKRKVGENIEPYDIYKNEVTDIPATKTQQRFAEEHISAYFFTKMLYSCLVDADFLDTERFMLNGITARGEFAALDIYEKKLEAFVEPWWNASSDLNKTRCGILRALMEKANSERGLFSLTVPTGGGKTISSMAFALKHASKHGLERIIYVIPYTSIIEQTQDVFEKIFGCGSIVAHHSNVDFGNDSHSAIKTRHYLATENWDAPIILTTAVQFFESLYASKSSRCRKLHNIANSVLIFDEAQMLPVPYLTACTAAIAELVKNYNCSAVLCTATQPALTPLFNEFLPNRAIKELCPSVFSGNDIFHRVTYTVDGMLSDEELSMRLNHEKQVLCIVNSRKQAQKIYALLCDGNAFHLSTMMYPQHRRTVLAEIRHRLKEGLPCRVVSTSLVEAGVDVDFPCVYRAMAGLDSIIQAAGRCNREGKRSAAQSIVHIFDTSQNPPPTYAQNIASARRALEKYDRINSAEAIHSYFDFLFYSLKDKTALDNKGTIKSIRSGSMAFRTIAENFHLIDGCEYTIYIPREEGKQLTDALLRTTPVKSLMRKLGQFSVGLYETHFRQLLLCGAIEPVAENAAVLRDLSLYNEDTGLRFGVDEGKAIFI